MLWRRSRQGSWKDPVPRLAGKRVRQASGAPLTGVQLGRRATSRRRWGRFQLFQPGPGRARTVLQLGGTSQQLAGPRAALGRSSYRPSSLRPQLWTPPLLPSAVTAASSLRRHRRFFPPPSPPLRSRSRSPPPLPLLLLLPPPRLPPLPSPSPLFPRRTTRSQESTGAFIRTCPGPRRRRRPRTSKS